MSLSRQEDKLVRIKYPNLEYDVKVYPQSIRDEILLWRNAHLVEIAQLFKNVADLEASVTPNLTDDLPSKEDADAFIERIDNWFEDEISANSNYWKNVKCKESGPEYYRLDSPSRLAFHQMWYKEIDRIAKSLEEE